MFSAPSTRSTRISKLFQAVLRVAMESFSTFLTSVFSRVSGDHFRAPVGRFEGPRGVENLGTLFSRWSG